MKKRIIAVIMMVVMLMSAMGSMAFAADEVTAPGVIIEILDTEKGTEIKLFVQSGELTEFEYVVELEGMEEIAEVTCTVSSELEELASDNDGIVQSGFQYDTSYATIGGVFAEPVSYEGTIGSVFCEGGLADGTTISVYVNGELYTAVGYSKYVYGDVDGNGAVEAADALLTLKAVVKLETLNENQADYADVDGSGAIEAADALLILQKVVNLIELFPVEMNG